MAEADIIKMLFGLISAVNFAAWKRVFKKLDDVEAAHSALSTEVAELRGACKRCG